MYKTHKDSVPVRLLTTGCNTATENLSRFVEKHTAPLAQNLPHRIRDTDHFLEIIDNINSAGLPENVVLVSFDIVNMFPSISNKSGIQAVREELDSRTDKSPSTNCIVEALEITLTCNNSKFNGQHLLQTDGTAMGAPNSCSYADLATSVIDKQIFDAHDDFPELFHYSKFPDDTFSLWSGDVNRLDNFLDFINTLDTNVKFTMEIGVLFTPNEQIPPDVLNHLIKSVFPSSPSESVRSCKFEILNQSLFTMWTNRISELSQFCLLLMYHSGYTFSMVIGRHKLRFLDVHVSNVNNKLETTVYSKPTSSHMYLHNSSCHPSGCKKGISKGVALRLRRICSSDEEYNKQAELYKSYLVSRGHNPKLVNQEFENIRLKSRHEVRQKTTKNTPGKAFFIAQFNPRGANVSHIVSKHCSILKNDPVASKIFPEGSVKVVNKRCQKLKELLLRADPYSMEHNDVQLGNVPCGKKCDACNNFLTHSTTFTSFATGRKFLVRKHLSCKTPYVVYLATCANCNCQGVGSTDLFSGRLSTYKNHSKSKVDSCCITEHWNHVCRDPKSPVAFMKFQLIDCVDNTQQLTKEQINNTLLDKERLWMSTLQTIHHGLNSKHDWNRVYRAAWSANGDIHPIHSSSSPPS